MVVRLHLTTLNKCRPKRAGQISGLERFAIISEPTSAVVISAEENQATIFDGKWMTIRIPHKGDGTTKVDI